MLPSNASEVEPENGDEPALDTPPTATAGLFPALEPSGAASTPQADPAVSLAELALMVPLFATVDEFDPEPPASASGNNELEQFVLELLEIVDVLV